VQQSKGGQEERPRNVVAAQACTPRVHRHTMVAAAQDGDGQVAVAVRHTLVSAGLARRGALRASGVRAQGQRIRRAAN